MILLILVLILAFHLECITAQEYCDINPIQFAKSPAIISGGTTTILYPEHGQSTLQINSGEIIDFACPGNTVLIPNVQSTEEVVSATCISNTDFNILGKTVSWTNVTCADNAEIISRTTGTICEKVHKELEIGFRLGDGRFITIFMVCFDINDQTPLYTYFEMTASIEGRSTQLKDLPFNEDPGFYKISEFKINDLYNRRVQRKTINSLIGLSPNDATYIQNGNMFFLSRGHLTAKADFFYPFQQNSTYRVINIAPQWQPFNGRNWAEIEINTRNYANRIATNVHVWTGVFGTMTYINTPLYLYSSTEKRALPVPEIYWKVVYNEQTNESIAIIGVNNVYERPNGHVCTDVSKQLTRVPWDNFNVANGYSYACAVSDLRRAVPYVPNLNTKLLIDFY